jgi:hypothetical protein
MNKEQQRIAIAEACGWTKIFDWKAAGINGQHPTEPWTEVIPDYLNDLNAMHEAEKFVGLHGEDFKGRKVKRIWATHCPCADPRFATAAQRAEAFLKTLNLWIK